MINPTKFAAASDFDAIGNILNEDRQVVVSVSGTLPATGSAGALIEEEPVAIVTPFLMPQPYVVPSTEPTRSYLVSQSFGLQRMGSTATFPGSASYTVFPYVYNNGSELIVCGIYINNPYGEVLTLVTENYTFTLKGMVPPFAGDAS